AVLPPAPPQSLWVLLVEAERGLRARHLEQQAVLPARRHLADHDRAKGTSGRGELHGHDVLGGDGAGLRITAALVHRRRARTDRVDAITGDELQQVAPVRADVAERACGPA